MSYSNNTAEAGSLSKRKTHVAANMIVNIYLLPATLRPIVWLAADAGTVNMTHITAQCGWPSDPWPRSILQPASPGKHVARQASRLVERIGGFAAQPAAAARDNCLLRKLKRNNDSVLYRYDIAPKVAVFCARVGGVV